MKQFIDFLLFRNRLKKKMEETHQLEDPWKAERMKGQLHGIIENYVSPCKTILEIGSGDGIVSEKLVEKCDRLFCVEISKRAIAKAKQNLTSLISKITFINKDIYSVSLKTYDTVVMSFVLDYLGQNQFAKKFIWLIMDLCGCSREILIIQPIYEEIDMKKLETIAVILHKNGFEHQKSGIEKESTPHLYVGLFAKQ